MSDQRFPLVWPDHFARTPAAERRDGTFRVTPARAFDELVAGAKRFGADPIVSMNAPRRNSDGRPYADALDDIVADPGVVLYLTRGGKRLAFPCDTYRTMRENIRGIHIAIESFRALERHGVQQLLSRAMQGFTALPPPPSDAPALRPPGPRHWTDVLGVPRTATEAQITEAYKDRARKLAQNGDGGMALQELNIARDQALKEVANG